MSDTKNGGCACGALRYEITGEPIFVGHCHCRECQRASGGPMSSVVGFPAAGFRLTRGTPKTYSYRGDSGQMVERAFCGSCGASLYTKPQLMGDAVLIALPSLDDSSWAKPAMHVYMASAQPWDPTGAGLPRFDKLPQG